MPDKVNSDWMRRARLWLAARLAPAGVEVRDTREHLCDCWVGLLELVQFRSLREPDESGEILAPVNCLLDELVALGAVDYDNELTSWGMQELARMWGPGTVPPWGGSWLGCSDHGVYEALPGDPSKCPDCPEKTIIERPRPWWSWLLSGRMSRYPL